MSRTDVHRPVWVQQKDPTVRHWFKDFHNHEDGICNLEEFLETGEWTNPLGCYRQQWTQCPNLCGCKMCTMQFYIRLSRRAERQRVKRALRKGLGEDGSPKRINRW